MPSCLVIAGRHREMIQLPDPLRNEILLLNIVVHQGNLVVDVAMITPRALECPERTQQ
jgi:hypothetical protein